MILRRLEEAPYELDVMQVEHPARQWDEGKTAGENLETFSDLPLQGKFGFLDKLSTSQWREVLQQWPASAQGADSLIALFHQLPHGNVLLTPYCENLARGIMTHKNLNAAFKVRTASSLIQLKDIYKNLNIQRMAENTIRDVVAFSTSLESKMFTDVEALAQAVHIAYELEPIQDYIQRNKIDSRNVLQNIRNYFTHKVLIPATRDSTAMSRCFDVLNRIMSMDQLFMYIAATSWFVIKDTPPSPEEAVYHKETASEAAQEEAAENTAPKIARMSVTGLNQIKLHKLMDAAVDAIKNGSADDPLKEKLAEHMGVIGKDQAMLVSVVQKTIRVNQIGDEEHAFPLSRELLILAHKGIQAKIPENIDDMAQFLLQHKIIGIMWYLRGTDKDEDDHNSSYPSTVTILNAISADPQHPEYISGIIRDPEGKLFPQIVIGDTLSIRSVDYLNLFLDVKEQVPLEKARERAQKLTEKSEDFNNYDFDHIASYIVALEAVQIEKGTIDPEEKELLTHLAGRLTDFLKEPRIVPLLVAMTHVTPSKSTEDNQPLLLDLLKKFAVVPPLLEERVLMELRRFDGYHLSSKDILTLHRLAIKRMDEENLNDPFSLQQTQVNKFILYKQYSDLLPQIAAVQHWRWVEGSYLKYSERYATHGEDLQKHFEAYEQSINPQSLIKEMIEKWYDLTDKEKSVIQEDLLYPDGFLHTAVIKIVQSLPQADTISWVSSEIIPRITDNPCAAILLHCLLSLSPAEKNEEIDSAKELIFYDALHKAQLPSYPRVVNYPLLLSKLNDGNFLVVGDGNSQMAAIKPPHEISKWKWPLHYDDITDVEVVQEAIYLENHEDSPLLLTPDRIRNSLIRGGKMQYSQQELNRWLDTLYDQYTNHLNGLNSRQIALSLPRPPNTENKEEQIYLSLFDQEGIKLDPFQPIPQLAYPVMQLYIGVKDPSTARIGIEGKVIFTDDLAFDFYLTTGGPVFLQVEENKQQENNQNIIYGDDLDTVTVALIAKIHEELISGDRLRRELDSSLGQLSFGAPSLGSVERVRFGTQEFQRIIGSIEQNFAFMQHTPQMWLMKGCGIFITEEMWNDPLDVFVDEARMRGVAPEQVVLELFDSLRQQDPSFTTIYIGRPVDESVKGGEVSRYKGDIKFYRQGEIQELLRGLNTHPEDHVLPRLMIYRKSTRHHPRIANIHLAHAFNTEVVTLIPIVNVDNKIYSLLEKRILTTFVPPHKKPKKRKTHLERN